MSTPQVGQGAVAVVPTFKGFRREVDKETDSAAKSSTSVFRRIWSKEGSDSGKTTGAGFKKAFEGQSTGFTSKATRELEQSVAKSASALSAARLKEQDATGKVRLAERQLAEARDKYASESSQVIRAEERLATASRQLETAHDKTKSSTNELANAQDSLARAADNAGDQLGQAGRKGATKFSSGFSDVFKGSFLGTTVANLASSLVSNIGQAIGTGLRIGIEFGLGTIDIASDLNESINAVQVSYGPIADAIFALGDGSAKTFGLSKRDLNGYAVQFSAFAKGIAGEGGDVAGTFQSILGRATDFASVMNLEVSEALGLFQSGLAGETEPLRKYGIDLSAAAVEAYALRAGIADGTEELTEAQKQQARYGYLLEQTSAVQGDFANTSSELANQNRINAAVWDDLQAKIGDAFLPIAQAVATVLAEDVFPVISELIDEYGPGMAEAFETAIPALKTLAEEVLPKLPELFDLVAQALPLIIQGFTDILPPLIDFGGKLVNGAQQISDFFDGLGEKLENGGRQWGEFFGAFGQWWDESLQKFANGYEQISSFFQGVGDKLANGGRQIGEFAGAVGTGIGNAVAFVQELPGRIGIAVAQAGVWLFNSGKALIQGFIDGIKSMLKPVGDAIGGVMSFVGGFFPNSPAKRGEFSGSGWARVKSGGSALLEQFNSGMANARTDVSFGAYSASLIEAKTGYAASSASSPRELVIVDADGQLIGRMRVEAGGVVKNFAREKDDEDRRGYVGGL